jgi:hypothetical protein
MIGRFRCGPVNCLRMVPASGTPIRKESQVTFRSPMLRRLIIAWLALLAFFALAAVMTARPAEAAPRPVVAVVQDDDDGGGDDADDDSGARGDDDDDDDDGGRGGDDDSGGVRDVPQGGIDTGAGGTTAGAEGQSGPGAVPYALAGGGLLVAAVTALLRRVTGGEGA